MHHPEGGVTLGVLYVSALTNTVVQKFQNCDFYGNASTNSSGGVFSPCHTATLVVDGRTFASWWGIGENLTNSYPEGDPDREFEIWASLKFIGPKFGSETKDGKNRMVCDRFFLVDKSGRKYKGETK